MPIITNTSATFTIAYRTQLLSEHKGRPRHVNGPGCVFVCECECVCVCVHVCVCVCGVECVCVSVCVCVYISLGTGLCPGPHSELRCVCVSESKCVWCERVCVV